MTEAEKEAIRASIDIVDLISGYTALKRSGARWKGLCPFHQERTPSFQVDPEKGRWHCFGGCSTGGDIFTFLEKAENLTFIEAAERLAERAGITLTPYGGGDREVVRRGQQEKDAIYRANSLAQRFFREWFGKASLAREYAEQRGLSHQTIEAFGIGYAPDDWGQLSAFLFKHGVHAEDAEKARLIFPSRRGDGTYVDQFRGRLIFPIVDVQERVVGFGGRLIVPTPNAPKYLNSPETPVFLKSRTLYALNRARKAIQEHDRIVVVEGYTDAVACHQAGIAYVVATLGTSLTDEHVRLIGRYTKNVILSFDADAAGVRAALRAAELFQAADPDFVLRVLTLPEGDDPGSILLDRKDVATFHRALDAARTVPEFRVDVLRLAHDLDNDAGRAAFLREAAAVIAEVRSSVERDRLIRRLASYALGSTSLHAEETIRAEVRRAAGGRLPDDLPPPPPQQNGYRRGGGGAGSGNNGNYRGNYRNGGGGGRYGGGGPQQGRSYNNSYAQQQRSPYRGGSGGYGGGYGGPDPAAATPPQPPPAPGGGPTVGLRRAETMVLRALLTSPFAAKVAPRLKAGLFDDPLSARLAQVLLPLLQQGATPESALKAVTDDDLRSHADALLMDDRAEPLSEQGIADSLRKLVLRENQRKMKRLEAQIGATGEGNAAADDELLRRWEQELRAAKRLLAGDDAPGQREESA